MKKKPNLEFNMFSILMLMILPIIFGILFVSMVYESLMVLPFETKLMLMVAVLAMMFVIQLIPLLKNRRRK
jgi:hypothetical protein